MTDLQITQIPAVLGALKTALAARPAYAVENVPVDLGWPSPEPKSRHVWIDGSVDSWEQTWLTTPQGDTGYAPSFEESFTVTVNVLWSVVRAAFEDLMAGGFAMAGEIDQVVVDDFTIGGTADVARPVGGEFNEDYTPDRGRRILIVRRIEVQTSWPR